MTGRSEETSEPTKTEEPTIRRAEIRTTHGSPEIVAAAVAPDDTEEMDTWVEGDEVEGDEVEDGTVVMTVERETTGGLASTVDDYVVNLSVADRTVEHASEYTRHTHDTTNE